MSIAEVHAAVNGAIAEAAQLQAFLRTIHTELALIKGRMMQVSEGTSSDTLPAGNDHLSAAQRSVTTAIEELQAAKSDYYDYLSGSR